MPRLLTLLCLCLLACRDEPERPRFRPRVTQADTTRAIADQIHVRMLLLLEQRHIEANRPSAFGYWAAYPAPDVPRLPADCFHHRAPFHSDPRIPSGCRAADGRFAPAVCCGSGSTGGAVGLPRGHEVFRQRAPR